MEIYAGIRDFYCDVIATVRISFREQKTIKEIHPLGRMDFVGGAGVAVGFTAKQVALTAFSLFKVIGTLGQKKEFRDSLSQHSQKIVVYTASIGVGIAGIVLPKIVNEKILQIPLQGLTVTS